MHNEDTVDVGQSALRNAAEARHNQATWGKARLVEEEKRFALSENERTSEVWSNLVVKWTCQNQDRTNGESAR